MNRTARHIEHLLLEHNYVIVPGLGTFLRHTSAAKLNAWGITPPSCEISFSTDIDSENDVELAASLARATGCSAEECDRIIAADVDDMRRAIASAGYAQLGTLGRLEADGDNLTFKRTQAFGGAQALGWLKPLELQEIAPAKAETTPAESRTDTPEHTSFIRSLHRTASSAAAIALLALIAFVASQIPRRRSAEPQMASMGIERLAANEVNVTGFERPSEREHALVLILNTPADGMSIVEPKEKDAAPLSAELSDTPGRYCLVVASLASDAEANVFIDSYPSHKLNLLEKDGRYRVYAASANTINGVKDIARADSLYAAFPSAWICRN